MGFVLLGVLLLLLRFAEIDPVAHWSWWAVVWPFGAAIVWWWIADATGMTQRAAMRRHEARVRERRDKMSEALGVGTKRRRR